MKLSIHPKRGLAGSYLHIHHITACLSPNRPVWSTYEESRHSAAGLLAAPIVVTLNTGGAT